MVVEGADISVNNLADTSRDGVASALERARYALTMMINKIKSADNAVQPARVDFEGKDIVIRKTFDDAAI